MNGLFEDHRLEGIYRGRRIFCAPLGFDEKVLSRAFFG